jgi:hypothetical protein
MVALLSRPNAYDARLQASDEPQPTEGSTTTVRQIAWLNADPRDADEGVHTFSGPLAQPASHAALAEAFRQRRPIGPDPDEDGLPLLDVD